MTILDYTVTDLLFAHWLNRKREFLPNPCPAYVDQQLDLLRPARNPRCSIFILDK